MGARQRERLWPVFNATRESLKARGLMTRPALLSELAALYRARADKPFSHVVVDEAQDLGVPELRFLASIAPNSPEAMYFAGDLGQRIFQPPISWRALGIDVRGRSTTLQVNYRTSRQIRQAADRLLPPVVRDVDGREEDRRGTTSVFEGPEPATAKLPDIAAEVRFGGNFIRTAVADGIQPAEVAVFVRTRAQLDRARATIVDAGFRAVESLDEADANTITMGAMHLAKGLEFRAVLVMACDAELLPLAERIAMASDEADLDEVYETERQLLYVACTRARDRLAIAGVRPTTEYLDDFGPN